MLHRTGQCGCRGALWAVQQGTLTFIYARPVESFCLLHCWDIAGAGRVKDIWNTHRGMVILKNLSVLAGFNGHPKEPVCPGRPGSRAGPAALPAQLQGGFAFHSWGEMLQWLQVAQDVEQRQRCSAGHPVWETNALTSQGQVWSNQAIVWRQMAKPGDRQSEKKGYLAWREWVGECYTSTDWLLGLRYFHLEKGRVNSLILLIWQVGKWLACCLGFLMELNQAGHGLPESSFHHSSWLEAKLWGRFVLNQTQKPEISASILSFARKPQLLRITHKAKKKLYLVPKLHWPFKTTSSSSLKMSKLL